MSQVNVVWLAGSIHERKSVLGKLLKQFEGHEIQRFGNDVSYTYVEQNILTSSCFSEKRLVILNDLPQPPGTKPSMLNSFKKLMEHVPSDCVLVFDGVDAPALQAHAAKIGKVFASETTIARADVDRWVLNRFVDLGKTITEDNVRLVVQSCGYDLSLKGFGVDQLRLAIQKIVTYMGRRKAVATEDIIVNALGTEEFNQWRVFDAMDSKKFEACQNSFQQFIENEPNWQRAVEKLYNMALPRYRLLFFLKEGLAKKTPKDELVKEALKLQKTVKSETTGLDERVPAYSEAAVNAALSGFYGRPPTVDLYTRKELVRIVDCLQEGTSEVRFRGDTPAVLLLADTLFMACCTKVEDEVLTGLRKSYV